MSDNTPVAQAPTGDRSLMERIYMKGHIITWALSVASACLVGWAWVYTHPTPKLAAVNIQSIVQEHTQALTAAIKPDTPKEEQEAAIRRAAEFGQRLDAALAVTAKECGCAIVNAAAIVAMPSAPQPIADITERVRARLQPGLPGASKPAGG